MNINDVKNILNNEKKKMNTNVSEWLSFLETSAYHYKHSIDAQVMIHAFNPEAKACADIMVWTNLRRNTVSGNSIPVIKNGNITHLYDITQTESGDDGSSVNPWIWSVKGVSLNTSYEDTIGKNLTEKYKLKSDKFSDKLYELSFKKTAEYLNDRKSAFAWLTAESAAYCVMHRCCPDEVSPSLKNLSHLDKFDFEKIAEAVCGVSSEILSEIEAIAKSERSKEYQNIRSKNNEKTFQRSENNQRYEAHNQYSDRRMDSGNQVRKRDDLDSGRTDGNNDVLRSGGRQIEAVGDNKENERRGFQTGGRSEQENGGTSGEIRNDGRGIQPDSAGRSSQILQDGSGILEGNSGRGSTGGKSSREIYNAAQKLSDGSSSGGIFKNEGKRNAELSSGGNKFEGARADGDSDRSDEKRQSGIREGGGTGGFPENSAADGIVQSSSGGNDTKGDNLQRVNSSDIIGNTIYRYIKQKTYHKYDTEIAKKIASELDKDNIKFSGRIKGDSTTLTISKFDLEKFKEIENKVKNENNEFATGESEKEVYITQADIDLLRSLEPRKSVLNFTSEEIKLTENWQHRFDSDISKKSPYYRVVNGDWREHDDSRVSIIEVEDRNADFKSVRDDIKSQTIKRGNVINHDTNWSIQISRNGLEDSVKYAFTHKDNTVYNMLYHIKDIAESGILLDSVVSEKNNSNKANNTAFMHKFYNVFRFNGEPYLAKTTVEEFADSQSGTLKRVYNIQDIKIEPLRHIEFADNNQLARSVLNGSDISISELFRLVKSCDRDFYLNKREKEASLEFAIGESEKEIEPSEYRFVTNATAEKMFYRKYPVYSIDYKPVTNEKEVKNAPINYFHAKVQDYNKYCAFDKLYENHMLTDEQKSILNRLEMYSQINGFEVSAKILDEEIFRRNYGGSNRINEKIFDGNLHDIIDELREYITPEFDLCYEYVKDTIRVFNGLDENNTIAVIDSDRKITFNDENRLPGFLRNQIKHISEAYALPLGIPEPEKALPGEPIVTIGFTEHPELSEGMNFPISQADRLFAELDKKQQSDREIYEDAGWYHKTDFTVEFEINGETSTYKGRYDIGDGDGSLTEHIKSYAQYMLKDDIIKSFSSDEKELDENKRNYKYILNELIPLFEDFTEKSKYKYTPLITEDNYDTDRADVNTFRNKGKTVRSVDIPVKASDELRRRFELYGLKPSDEQTEISFSTYGNDSDWNRFEIRDKYGNRWVYVNARDMLSHDEMKTMKSVVSGLYNDNTHERSEIDDMLEFAQRAYYDSQYSGKDLYVYGAEPQMEQMSLFGEDEASSPVSEKSDQEKAITAVLMRGSGFADGKFRIADYADENHSINDFAEMLKKEYGIGGHSGDDVNYSWTSHDGKGIQITLPRTNESEEGEKITVSWKEAAKRISKLCEQGEYITEDDINNRIRSAKYVLKNYTSDGDLYKQHEIEQARKVLEEYGVESPEITEKKEYPQNIYRIYQLKDDEKYRGIRFEEITAFQKSGVSLGMDDYDLVYEGNIDDIEGDSIDDKLNTLYDRFNFEQPDDYKGRSLSVSDVITVKNGKYESAYYIDSFGFADMPEFFKEKKLSQDKSAPTLADLEVGDVILYDGKRREVEQISEKSISLKELDAPDFGGILLGVSDVLAYNGWQQDMESKGFEILSKADKSEKSKPAGIEKSLLESSDIIKTNVISSASASKNTFKFTISDDILAASGAKSKFKANIAAIETLQKVESENRNATPKEQEIMSGYAGWGGLSEAFDSSKEKWAEEYAQLKELLTEEEYASAKASVLDSFYTPPYIIESIYSALKNMGFDGGNILEPALGVGNFFGKMPEAMYKESRIYGTEIDSISGRIAKRLYPDADISITGFEKKDFPDSFFDLAIGNVPFGGFKVPDRRYDKYNFAVHDYFFAKALDKVRPGGIVAFITSKGTLDKANPSVRKYISQRAELLGAVRLPNTAFKSYAGTEVTSDIIFLQKRERMIDIAPEWVYTGTDGKGFTCNQYFIDNPDMILGGTVEGNKLYGKGTMVIPFENSDLKEQLQNAVLKIKGEYSKESAVIAEVSNTKKSAFVPEVIPANPNVKNFTYTEINGKIFYRENSVMTEISFKGKKFERIKGMIAINKCVRELLDMQLSNYSDEAIKKKQSELNGLYDLYTKKYGLLNSRVNKSVFKEDVSLPLLTSLEKVKNGKLVQKADIFTKRTIRPPVKITHAETASEALAVSISERACVDLGFMASLMGGSEKIEQIKADLKGVIYKNPEKDDNELSGWETADEYLSGNIREKLSAAKKAAEDHPIYKENIQALEAVMPERLEAGDIKVKLGAPWIDKKYIAQFIYEILETPKLLQYSPINALNTARIDIQHSEKTASWEITNKSLDSGSIKATVTYGTARKNAYEIIEDSLNQRDTTVNDPTFDDDGKIHYVLNHKETVLARQKQEAINNAFREWIFRDRDRRKYLVENYNVLYNSIRPREYDGSHLTFVGMNPEKELRPHQKDAVARALYGGNTLFAHDVGAGKTYEMIATAMEGKRLGLCSKSLIAVPNHLPEQFANDFMELYPNANILVAGEKDFKKENRQKLCAKMATGDFDAVIIGHSQLIKIGVSPEREQEFIKRQIEEVTADISEIKAQNGEHFTIKEMEKTKKDMETRLKQLADRTVKDDVITFEQLGVDKLFIDEADMFKNLGLSTKMRNISGVSANTKVQKTQDLYMKCQYLDELTGGKGIVFATGTPVSNSISEIYTMQRYLQADLLRKNNLTHFDSWAASFAEKVTKLEFAPEGTGFRQKTRLAKFFNLPELMTMFKECADIKTAADLNLPTPECEIHNISVNPTETQKSLVKALGERAEKIHNKTVTPDVDNMLKVTTDGRKTGLDQRLINPLLPDEPGTKVNACIDNVYRIWNETSENRSTQLIFCDYGVPTVQKKKKDKDGNIITENEEDFTKFNIYDDIRSKLINMGVPQEEIAFIHSVKTKEAKEKLFEKVRNGDVRILIGSTSKMGAGTNVQNKLIASHDLDCPWKPRDMEQRRGRMVRQGNENKKVHLFRYVTKDTFDAYLFQTLENKQKFISQIMTSKTPARSCDDIDESTLSYAEVKALCIANPHIKEKMELDIEISKLHMIKSEFMNQHYRLENNVLKIIPEKLAEKTAELKNMEADKKALAEYPIKYDNEGYEIFSPMTVNGRTYTERKEAGEALIKAAIQSTIGNQNKAVTIGEYKGFKLDVYADSFDGSINLFIKGNANYHINMSESPTGNITRINNVLDNMENSITICREEIEKLNQNLVSSKAELRKPFPQEQELKDKLERQTELALLLNLDNTEKQQEQTKQKASKNRENDMEI